MFHDRSVSSGVIVPARLLSPTSLVRVHHGRLLLPGSATLLQPDRLALFCFIRCPDDVILKIFDLIRAIREADIPVIGGFHTPMERVDWLPASARMACGLNRLGGRKQEPAEALSAECRALGAVGIPRLQAGGGCQMIPEAPPDETNVIWSLRPETSL